LIAAESSGRRACLLEYDPAYCDSIIARWESFTGKQATLNDSGRTYETIAGERFGGSDRSAKEKVI
jgi:hypothetical protein